ncbi:MAG: urea transporter [Candidatus Hydrogenedentota bacterium]
MWEKVKRLLIIYSEIFFTDNLLLGIIVFIATLLDFNTGLCGLAAIFSAYLFNKLTFSPELRFEPFYYYNPLLVGLSIGVLFKISILTGLLIFASAILAFVLSVVLNFLLKKYTGLPVLSLPFVIVSSFVYLATIRSSNLFSNYLIPQPSVTISNLPIWLNGYFLSLGSIFFSKNIIVGLLVAFALLLHSRIVFLLSIIGYYAGAIITGEFNSTLDSTYLNLNYFNYILIAIAIGSIYLIPSFKSYIIAIFAVAVSYVILGATEVFVGTYGIPVFTLPFNITVLCFIYYSDIINWKLRIYTYLKNPETNLDFYINYTTRFGFSYPLISLPFSGEWKLSQGFDDEITHKGPWKYGVDFVLVNDKNEQYEGNPARLESYYAYAKPVFSPVSGSVSAVVNDIPDNDIGSVNREDNWGNYIIIYDSREFYVKICHLKKGSIIPLVGSYVETGQLIGYCGNSGYSPAPHIHIQLQTGVANSSPTIEFNFEQVLLNRRFYPTISPQKGQLLSSIYSSIKKKKVFELLLGDTFEYNFRINNKETKERIEVVMDTDGTTYLKNRDSRLYFIIYKNIFRFYKYIGSKDTILQYIFLTVPSLPLCENKIAWDDPLPLEISLPPLYKNILILFQSLYAGIVKNEVSLEYKDNFTIESINNVFLLNKKIVSLYSTVKIDSVKFIESIKTRQRDREIEISVIH